MASPRQLVNAVAEALQVSPEFVGSHDRFIGDAGLRSKGGRGRSAAKMTALDGAHLFLSVAATPLRGPSTTEAASYLRINATLPDALAVRCEFAAEPVRITDGRWHVAEPKAEPLLALPEGHTAGMAIAAIIESIHRFTDKESVHDVIVTVSDPIPEVEITWWEEVGGKHVRETHVYSVGNFVKGWEWLPAYPWRYHPFRFGLTQSRTFDLVAMRVVSDCLFGERAG